jgi:glyoxylase-like metal-dependent hydrolase (beta-lactamase superfamily II)
MPGYEAERIFERAPSAILMTHAHFDDTGGLLADDETQRRCCGGYARSRPKVKPIF